LTAEASADARKVLSGIPLFADVLAPDQLAVLAAGSHPAFFRSGTLLMSQGDLGGSMFAIVDGVVSVNFADQEGHEQIVAKLGPGEIVGEMSVFTGDRRTATVSALTNVDALEISRAALEKVFAKSPDLLDKFGAVLAGRQAELSAIADRLGAHGREDFARRARRFFARLFSRGKP
jgi:CRP/FNR family transcriptional regulator, cyclic AMP receptor protein